MKLSITSPMYRVAKAMAAKDSGLEVKDRMWLKMTIPNSFIGKRNKKEREGGREKEKGRKREKKKERGRERGDRERERRR